MITSQRSTRSHFRLLVVAVASLAFLSTGCSSDTTATGSTPSGPSFTLSEFTVKLDRPALPTGKVTLTANNVGGEEHELVLVRASTIADLPTKSDGSVDEDKIAAADKVGEIDHVAVRGHKSADFTLTPGTYVAFCNIVDQTGSGAMMGNGAPGTMMGGMGHVHFANGMHQIVTVK